MTSRSPSSGFDWNLLWAVPLWATATSTAGSMGADASFFSLHSTGAWLPFASLILLCAVATVLRIRTGNASGSWRLFTAGSIVFLAGLVVASLLGYASGSPLPITTHALCLGIAGCAMLPGIQMLVLAWRQTWLHLVARIFWLVATIGLGMVFCLLLLSQKSLF